MCRKARPDSGPREYDGAAHRAAEHRRPFEPKRDPDRADDGDIGFSRQAEFLEPPAVRRRRAAVIRHIKGDDAKPSGDRAIIHHVTELPAIVARRVQTKQRQTAAGLFDENPVPFAGDVDRDVAAGDRLEVRHRASPFPA
jgi:hypothetical protein